MIKTRYYKHRRPDAEAAIIAHSPLTDVEVNVINIWLNNYGARLVVDAVEKRQTYVGELQIGGSVLPICTGDVIDYDITEKKVKRYDIMQFIQEYSLVSD
jgi:hypothetical protein